MLELKGLSKNGYAHQRDYSINRVWPLIASLLLAAAIAISGCATLKGSAVNMGDQADVHFTCRFNNGEIAISTYQDVATNNSLPKSKIFLPRDRNTPLQLTAGKAPKGLEATIERGFEGEVMYQVTNAIVGMPVGQIRTLEILPEPLPKRYDGEQILKMARTRQRPKEMRFKPEDYISRRGKKAEVDQPFVIDPAIPGKVVSVTETEVIIQFSAIAGSKVTTPFGEGTISELPDRYETVIDARLGTLVRSGGLIGRIVNVDDRNITIDYSHPFGGEVLMCDILVESVSPAPAQAAIQGEEVAGQKNKNEKSVVGHEEKQALINNIFFKTQWIEDHDAGLASAKKEAKPAVLVLYADWCEWCKRLINESFQAPTVQELEEKMVLIKVNSDKQKEIYAQYQQKGYPLLVLFDREGKVAQRIDGYVDAAKLRKALDELLKG